MSLPNSLEAHNTKYLRRMGQLFLFIDICCVLQLHGYFRSKTLHSQREGQLRLLA